MRFALAVALGAALVLAVGHAQGQAASSPVTNSFDLEVTLDSPFSTGEFSMLTTIRADEPFRLSATTEGQQREISGVLHCRHGKFLLDLTVVEPGVSGTSSGLELQLGKPTGEGLVASFVFLHIIKLQSHQSRVESLPPLPNQLLQPTTR